MDILIKIFVSILLVDLVIISAILIFMAWKIFKNW